MYVIYTFFLRSENYNVLWNMAKNTHGNITYHPKKNKTIENIEICSAVWELR